DLRRQLGRLGPVARGHRARVERALRAGGAHVVPSRPARPRAPRAPPRREPQAHARHGCQAPYPLRAAPGGRRRRAVRGAHAGQRDPGAHLSPPGGAARARRPAPPRTRLNLVPAVSIVLATYNQAPWLDGAIASVRQQTLTDWELVVVDDGST